MSDTGGGGWRKFKNVLFGGAAKKLKDMKLKKNKGEGSKTKDETPQKKYTPPKSRSRYTCDICYRNILVHESRYHCVECHDMDFCVECYEEVGTCHILSAHAKLVVHGLVTGYTKEDVIAFQQSCGRIEGMSMHTFERAIQGKGEMGMMIGDGKKSENSDDDSEESDEEDLQDEDEPTANSIGNLSLRSSGSLFGAIETQKKKKQVVAVSKHLKKVLEGSNIAKVTGTVNVGDGIDPISPDEVLVPSCTQPGLSSIDLLVKEPCHIRSASQNDSMSARIQSVFTMFADRPCLGTRQLYLRCNKKENEEASSADQAEKNLAGYTLRGPFKWVLYGDILDRALVLGKALENFAQASYAKTYATDKETVNENSSKENQNQTSSNDSSVKKSQAGEKKESALEKPVRRPKGLGRPCMAVCTRTSYVERYIADLAGMLYGLTVTPINITSSGEAMAHIINKTALGVVVCGEECVDRFIALKKEGSVPTLATLIIVPDYAHFDREELERKMNVPFSSLPDGLEVYWMPSVEKMGSTLTNKPHGMGLDEVATIIWTTGSTGMPKGICVRERNWTRTFAYSRHAGVNLSYSFSDRRNDYLTVFGGGRIGLYSGAAAFILEDIQELEPTSLCQTPRLYNMIYAEYQQALATYRRLHPKVDSATAKQRVLKSFSNFLGSRISHLITGGAPTSPVVMEFLRRCFGCPVIDSYGSTEIGGICRGGFLIGSVEYRLEAWGGYSPDDKPLPRGELLVRSARKRATEYFDEPEKSAAAWTKDGFFHTGDVVEIGPEPRRCTVIDRCKNFLKLQQGEYLSPEKVEAALLDCEFVNQIWVHGTITRSYVVAVVVPNDRLLLRWGLDENLIPSHLVPMVKKAMAITSTKPIEEACIAASEALKFICTLSEARALVSRSLHEAALTHKLQSWEIPREIMLESVKFSPANSLLSEGLKLMRPALRKKYGQILEELMQKIDRRQGSGGGITGTVHSGKGEKNQENDSDDSDSDDEQGPLTLEKIEKIFTKFLADMFGASEAMVQEDFTKLGGDSIAAIRIQGFAKRRFQVQLPLQILFQYPSVRPLSRYIHQRVIGQDNELGMGGGLRVSQRVSLRRSQELTEEVNWSFEAQLPDEIQPLKKAKEPSAFPHQDIMVTGATGFLGGYLVGTLLKKTQKNISLYCLVRSAKRAVAPRVDEEDTTGSNASPTRDSKSSSPAPTDKREEPTAQEADSTERDSGETSSDVKQEEIEPCSGCGGIVCCLKTMGSPDARDVTEESCARRLCSALHALEIHKMCDAKAFQRIVVVPGRLCEGFGIAKDHYQTLASQIASVYHSAARVNSVLPYAAMKSANVGGTTELIKFCATVRRKELHYVSTLSILPSRGNRDEYTNIDGHINLLRYYGGYNQSKWVAERRVRAAFDRGFDVVIYRPGMISACSFSGAANVEDFDNRLLRGVILHGVAPEVCSQHPASVGLQTNDRMDMTPVDFVANSIVSVSQSLSLEEMKQGKTIGKGSRLPYTFHLANPTGSPRMSEILRWATTFGYKLNFVSYEDWSLHELPQLPPSNPIYPMVGAYFSGRISFPFRSNMVANLHTTAHLAKCNASPIPPIVNEEVIHLQLAWLASRGLIPLPKAAEEDNLHHDISKEEPDSIPAAAVDG